MGVVVISCECVMMNVNDIDNNKKNVTQQDLLTRNTHVSVII